MPDYTYVIVGGGMTADAAAQAIHEADPVGSIGVIGAKPHPPYDRPPLSKALWKGEPEDKIWRKTVSTGAQLHLGRRIGAIDVRAHLATDDRGTKYRFTKLLLATGGTPRQLPLKTDQIIYFRTLDDYRRLRALASQSVRFCVIGGGFIGSEVAAALRMQGRDVTMLRPEAGLRVDNGVVVDEFCRTSHPDVYAAGDVANFANPALGTRLRVEHEDNANTMGRTAGLNMAGRATAYDHLPFFYSDLFDLGYEAVGDLDARLEKVTDWKVPFREGVVYYLKGGRVRGVLLWNTWGQVDHARALIAERGPFQAQDLKGRLPA